MRIREFERHIQELPAFNLNELRKLEPGFHRQQLSDWQGRGYIRPLAAGHYLLAGQAMDEATRFMLANQIYAPSYVSLESALAYYQVIPETVLGVTNISARKTQQFASDWGVFSYRSLQPQWTLGYRVVEARAGRKFKLASLEKAVLDTLYLNPWIQSADDLEGLRWNRQALAGLPETLLFRQYLVLFGKPALAGRARILKEYLDA